MNNRSSICQSWLTVVLLGLWFYALAGETLHFFNHFFPGLAVGVIILTVLASIGKSTKKFEFTIPFSTYLYAIIPEFIAIGRGLLSNSKMEHAPWENIFLFHNTFDHLLEQSELVVPITASVLMVVLYIYQLKKHS